MDIIKGIIKFSCYSAFRQVYIIGRNIVWLLNGTWWRAYQYRTKPSLYANSAHVHRIFARYKFDVLLGPANFMDFTLMHDSFVHPEYVLKENVSLYQVTKKHAIFVEVPEDITVWHCDNGSFLRQAQFNYAVRVITMPLHSFHTLAEKVGDPDAQLVFVQNTARCGSTLLVRIFEQTGESVAFSEPDALNAVASYAHNSSWDPKEVLQVTHDAVRLLCKPTKSVKKVVAYLMKMTILSIDGTPVLQELYPKSSHLFMYRDCLKVAESLMRIKEVLPMLKLAYLLANRVIDVSGPMTRMIGLSSKDAQLKVKSSFQTGVVLWCIVVKKYMDLRNEGTEIAGVAYEDIAEDPESALRAILKYCNLPERLIAPGMKAMENDAQGNSELAMSNIQRKKIDMGFTPEVQDRCNATLASFGYPALGQTFYFPGTITHKGNIPWPPK